MFCYLEVLRRFGKAGARSGRRPFARMVGGEMPACRPSHREPANHDPVFVDLEAPFDVREGLEQVGLAGELIGVAIAAVGLKHEGVSGHERTAAALDLIQEVYFAQSFAPAVKPDVEAP